MDDDALAKARELGDRAGEGAALTAKGYVYWSTHQLDKALPLYEQALPMVRAAGFTVGEANTLSDLGMYYWSIRQLSLGRSYFEQALPLYRQSQSAPLVANTLGNMGSVYRAMGRHREALPCYQEALGIFKTLQMKPAEADTLQNLGSTLLDISRPNEALPYFAQAHTIALDLRDRQKEALSLDGTGVAYRFTGKPKQAIAYHEQALAIYRATNNARGIANALINQGLAYYVNGQPEKALARFQEALPVARQARSGKAEGTALDSIGLIHWSTAKIKQALPEFEQALKVFRAIGERGGEANTLTNVGNAYRDLGQPQTALSYYQQAERVYREIGDDGGWAAVSSNVGNLYCDWGQAHKALSIYRDALPRVRTSGNKRVEANVLSDIGRAYHDLGQPHTALSYYEQALAIDHAVEDAAGEALALVNIGSIYQNIGRPDQALSYYDRALPVLRRLGDRKGEAAALMNAGRASLMLHNPDEALNRYKDCLEIYRAIPDRLGEANTLDSIGMARAYRGQYAQAAANFTQALPLAHAAGDARGEADALIGLGAVEWNLGRSRSCLDHLRRALDVSSAMQDKGRAAVALTGMATAEESMGSLDQAQRDITQAVALLETLRTSLGARSSDKTSFLETWLGTYHRGIDLLVKRHNPGAAFAVAQKAKARALLDLMSSGRVDFGAALSPEERERERQLRGAADFLSREIAKANLSTGADAEALLASLRPRERTAEAELQSYEDTLYSRHPELARKRAARTLTPADLPPLIGRDTALLEYVVLHSGEESDRTHIDRTVLFVVTADQGKPIVSAYPINLSRKRLEERAANFRGECASKDSAYQDLAEQLYQLLVAPAAKQIAGKKRLVICPDGPLWGLPFHALSPGGDRFLADRFEIDYAYSASGAQAALLAKRGKPTRRMLVMANPDFGDETRFGDGGAGSNALTADVQRLFDRASRDPVVAKAALTRAGAIQPLPGTQREADAIKRLFPDARVYAGQEAQESTLKQEAGQYRYVHLATHGFLNRAAPLLSSVVLAQPPRGSQEDGFLTAREIFDMRLTAEMVVLSACRTAQGENKAGEGIVGLTWAVFAAGAPTQVVSQWPVDDASTAELMTRFYGGLKAGQAKGAALHAAALSLRRQSDYRHPYYWAPFILTGDWR